MSQSNPFLTGYCDFQIKRLVCTVDTDTNELMLLPIHEKQENFDDIDLIGVDATCCNDFVLVDNCDPDIPEKLWDICDRMCLIVGVCYRLTALQFGGKNNRVNLGNFECKEEAQAVIDNIAFDTGFYSRLWEIDRNHLTREAFYNLCLLAESGVARKALFDVFQIKGTGGFAVKLLNTPWTEDHLQQAQGYGIEQLKQYQKEVGVPDELVNLLMLAGQTDVRLIIFDRLAATLKGLPVYPW